MTRRALLRLLMALGLTGCLHAAPLPEPHVYRLGTSTAVAPEEAPACTSLRLQHNVWLIAATVAGGISGAGGVAMGLETDTTQRIATGISAGVLGIAAAVMTTVAGITADGYARECTVSK